MYDKPKTKGYVTLITTLVVGSLAVLITVGMLSVAITQTQTSIVLIDGYRAGALADACAEYALQELRNDTGFVGSGTIALGAGSCDYDVNSNGGENKEVEVIGVVRNATRRVFIELDQINPSINITNWQYVDTF